MTDRESLLAAVLADPDADTPRLVFADYLDDAGEADRAAYIRHHVRGDPLPPTLLDASPSLEWVPPLPRHTRREGADRVEYLDGDGLRVTLVFRRGFVDELRLPLAAFVGGECGRCEDTVACRAGPSVRVYSPECPTCDGTGRTPGLAAELFRAHPITRVVLTDREPSHIRAYHASYWLWADRGGRATDDLPAALVGPMTADAPYRHLVTGYPMWRSPDAALNALSAACVAHGRSVAAHRPRSTAGSRASAAAS